MLCKKTAQPTKSTTIPTNPMATRHLEERYLEYYLSTTTAAIMYIIMPKPQHRRAAKFPHSPATRLRPQATTHLRYRSTFFLQWNNLQSYYQKQRRQRLLLIIRGSGITEIQRNQPIRYQLPPAMQTYGDTRRPGSTLLLVSSFLPCSWAYRSVSCSRHGTS